MTLGQKLRKIREEKGLSQKGLAKYLGIRSNSYVSDIEQGKFIPSMKKLKNIAKVLHISDLELKWLLLEQRLDEMGIRDPRLLDMIRNQYHRKKQPDKALRSQKHRKGKKEKQ